MSFDQVESLLTQAPLGKKSSYIHHYTPSLLFAVPRVGKRREIGLSDTLPFQGFDIWNGYELSWLNFNGKPIVATAEFLIPCESPQLIESKSFKLYLNSFNQSKFESFATVQERITKDLSQCAGAGVEVNLYPLEEAPNKIGTLMGTCLDQLDIVCSEYQPNPSYLFCEDRMREENLFTNLLKSNCLVTGQPDWGSLDISYSGKQINHEGLLKYIVSLRDHNEFHEQCVERIFCDIQKQCAPSQLTVFARYTRRGGLDINPYRSTLNRSLPNLTTLNTRLVRQ